VDCQREGTIGRGQFRSSVDIRMAQRLPPNGTYTVELMVVTVTHLTRFGGEATTYLG